MGLVNKLRMPMPRSLATQLNVDAVLDFILKAAASAQSSGFEWVNIHCPPEGSVLIIKLSTDSTMPPDGYGWMDEERKSSTIVNGKEIEMFERSSGFKSGDKLVTMKRKRFRVMDTNLNELNLIHYLNTEQNLLTSPVFDHLVVEKPTPAPTSNVNSNMAGSVQQQQQSLQQKQMMQAQMAQRTASMNARAAQQPATISKQSSQQSVKSVTNAQEDGLGLEDVDELPARKIASERFKRNLSFMEEIFSSHAIGEIKPPSLFSDLSDERIKELTEQVAKKSEEVENYKQHKDDDLAAFQALNVAVWNHIEAIKSGKDIGENVSEVENLTGIKLDDTLPKVIRKEIRNRT